MIPADPAAHRSLSQRRAELHAAMAVLLCLGSPRIRFWLSYSHLPRACASRELRRAPPNASRRPHTIGSEVAHWLGPSLISASHRGRGRPSPLSADSARGPDRGCRTSARRRDRGARCQFREARSDSHGRESDGGLGAPRARGQIDGSLEGEMGTGRHRDQPIRPRSIAASVAPGIAALSSLRATSETSRWRRLGVWRML